MIRRLFIYVLISVLLGGYSVAAQESTQPVDRVVGEVTKVDSANQQLTLKTSAGKVFLVKTNAQTVYRRVPLGETSLDKATTIAFADVAVGDRTIARGKITDDQVEAQSLIVVSGKEIAQKQTQNLEDWKKRGIKGTIVGINPGNRGLMVRMMTAEGSVPIRLSTDERTRFLRYGPDAVTYADAKPSSFDDLGFGDQIRALGDRTPDGRFLPEEIISGSFQMVGGIITEVNKETGEVKITDIKSKQPITIAVRKDSKLRRLPPDLIRKMEDAMAAAPSPSSGGMRIMTPGGGGSPGAGGGGRVMTPGQSPGGGPGGGPRPPAVDYGETVENLPAITVADLKPGEGIIVSSTKGSDPTRATAILLAGGLESFLKRMEENAKRPGYQLDLALPGLGGP